MSIKGGEISIMIYNPQEEYDGKICSLHLSNTNKLFNELVLASAIDIEANQKTIAELESCRQNSTKLIRKLNWLRFARVLMFITIILIPIVVWKITPKIRKLREDIAQGNKRADELLTLARNQMQPLNNLFTDRDALSLIEQTIPLIKFHQCFTAEQEAEMKINYDFCDTDSDEESTLDSLSGEYNENPFLFENKMIHRMGTETYHGYKTIYWTETYRDSNGKTRTRTRSETLHATVTKPKPYYSTQVVLYYGSQGAPDLCFSRDATNLDEKSEKSIKRYIKKGEKRLKKLTDKAIKDNRDFVSMSNTQFEVLFDALNRSDEIQYRTLFTPLAQTNMVDLILSKTSYGDDFNFIKLKRMNKIVSEHSQGRSMSLNPSEYYSYSFDTIKHNFISKNVEFFKAVYFDFAPLWAIPAYQERPVHSLNPIPEYKIRYSERECEALANLADISNFAHEDTKTKTILKAKVMGTSGDSDSVELTGYSYDIMARQSVVSVYGGDGRYHNVVVDWDEYIPLCKVSECFVSDKSKALSMNVMAVRNGICIFN